MPLPAEVKKIIYVIYYLIVLLLNIGFKPTITEFIFARTIL